MLLNPQATSLRSVTKTQEHPFRQWIKEGDFIRGFQQNNFEPYNIPRQELPESYFQTGDIEIIRRSTLVSGSISGNNVIPLFIEHQDMVDIDTDNDWKDAERK